MILEWSDKKMFKTKVPKYKSMSLTDVLNNYNKPKVVYIPLAVQCDYDITSLVKKDDYVYKGMIIAKSKGNLRTAIHSSVSGVVLGFEEKTYVNGDKVKCVVIENDFKEKVEKKKTIKKQINKYLKEEFIEIIKEAGIVGMGGSGFPTYAKYNCQTPIKTIIINAVECEPYITADYTLLMNKCEEILEAVDAMVEINRADEAIIAIKKGEHALKEHLNNFIGTYLKIRIVEVPNFYPMGWERNLVKYVMKKTYKKYPIERGIVVNNVATIYAIYEALKTGKPLMERIVTFTGEGLLNPQNVVVKVGTPVKDVIEYIGGYSEDELNFISGGPMMGEALDDEELIVTSNLNCVLIKKAKEIEHIEECLRCGKCVGVCPAKLSPVLIKDNIHRISLLKDLEPNKCIECGLCSFICPAKIPVREYVKLAKKEICEVDKK
jgi:Na+-translocating ferredoxin:NAD+ oxidoreductase subunit C